MENRSAGRRKVGRAPYRAAAICTPGLEFVCKQELLDLGCKPKPAGPGTVEFDATARQLYGANMWLRTASRVVVRVATFRSTDFAHFQRRTSEIDWSPWLSEGTAPTFRVSANESKLYHTKAIAQRLHQVVAPPSVGQPEQLFVVRIERNTVTISADASGDPLHHRPWRTELGDAPLRTTMAAAMLLATNWSSSESLIDPFCGSGTIPIEAALLARNLPPGGARSFAFQQWPDFEPGTWASVTGQASSSAHDGEIAPIMASDRDDAVIAAAVANAERAGVADAIGFEKRVVSHLPAAEGPGLVATNPPFGKRIGDGELRGLYRRVGMVVRERLPGWGLAMVCSDRKLAAAADRGMESVARFRHGGLAVQLFHRGPTVSDAAPTDPPTDSSESDPDRPPTTSKPV